MNASRNWVAWVDLFSSVLCAVNRPLAGASGPLQDSHQMRRRGLGRRLIEFAPRAREIVSMCVCVCVCDGDGRVETNERTDLFCVVSDLRSSVFAPPSTRRAGTALIRLISLVFSFAIFYLCDRTCTAVTVLLNVLAQLSDLAVLLI